MDTFDPILDLGEVFPRGMPNEGWELWIDDSFERSPLLCKQLEEKKRWYPRLYPVYQDWKQEQKPKSLAPPEPHAGLTH